MQVGLVLAVVAVGVWLGVDVVAADAFGRRVHVVADGEVVRSGKLRPAALKRVIETHGIRTIIDLGAFEEGSGEDRLQQRTADALGVTRYRFQLFGDTNGNPNHYVNALRIMQDPAMQPVLLHCGAGTERTGMCILYYRHLTEGLSFEAGYEDAKHIGHSTERNPIFLENLDEWGEAVIEAVRSGGAVDGVPPVPAPVPAGGHD
ncbi:MAG: tyrosine-protein phosphatase [Planctomycetota bacterium]